MGNSSSVLHSKASLIEALKDSPFNINIEYLIKDTSPEHSKTPLNALTTPITPETVDIPPNTYENTYDTSIEEVSEETLDYYKRDDRVNKCIDYISNGYDMSDAVRTDLYVLIGKQWPDPNNRNNLIIDSDRTPKVIAEMIRNIYYKGKNYGDLFTKDIKNFFNTTRIRKTKKLNLDNCEENKTNITKRVRAIKLIPKEYIGDYTGLTIEEAIEEYLKENKWIDKNAFQIYRSLNIKDYRKFEKAIAYIKNNNKNIIYFKRILADKKEAEVFKWCPEKKYLKPTSPEWDTTIRNIFTMFHTEIGKELLHSDYYELCKQYFGRIDRIKVNSIIDELLLHKFIFLDAGYRHNLNIYSLTNA
jgi:hypothetical protein